MASERPRESVRKPEKKLKELILFGLNHGIESIRIKGKGPLTPFIIKEVDGEIEIIKLFTSDPVVAVAEGIRLIRAEKKSQFAVLVYDGFLTFQEKRFHAVIAKGFDRNDSTGYSYSQRYIPQKFFSSFKLTGDKAYMGKTEQLLPNEKGTL